MARRYLPWVVLAMAVALPWLAGLLDQAYYIGFVRRVMIFALAAASLNFIMGYGGMVSLGHAAFFGIGAYTVGIAMVHGVASAWVVWPLAIVLASGAAILIGAVSLRTRGVYFIMITLAFAQMVYYLAVGLKGYGGEDGLSLARRSSVGLGVDLANETTLYYVVLAALAASTLALNRAVDSRYGRVLAGIRDNEARMEAIGFPTYRFKLVGFAIAGGLAGLAGALFANHNTFVSPAILHWTQSATLVVMVLLGGLGFRYGGIAGAIALLVLEETLASLTDFWHLPLGVLLLAVVFFAPRGLCGHFESKAAR